jgi:aspartate aminotransferase
VNGVSKAYAMTGWRLGYGAGPAELIKAMAVIQSQATSCPSSVGQAAAIAALTGPQDIVRERAALFSERRNLVVRALDAIDGLECRLPAGAFYAYPSCAGLIGRRTRQGGVIHDDRSFADYLLDWGVAVIPGSCFGLAPFFRISYATGIEELQSAMDRIDAACAGLEPAENGLLSATTA